MPLRFQQRPLCHRRGHLRGAEGVAAIFLRGTRHGGVIAVTMYRPEAVDRRSKYMVMGAPGVSQSASPRESGFVSAQADTRARLRQRRHRHAHVPSEASLERKATPLSVRYRAPRLPFRSSPSYQNDHDGDNAFPDRSFAVPAPARLAHAATRAPRLCLTPRTAPRLPTVLPCRKVPSRILHYIYGQHW